jgi:hypothetical protein
VRADIDYEIAGQYELPNGVDGRLRDVLRHVVWV